MDFQSDKYNDKEADLIFMEGGIKAFQVLLQMMEDGYTIDEETLHDLMAGLFMKAMAQQAEIDNEKAKN